MATTALGLALQISASTAGLAKSVNEVNSKLDSMAEAGKKSAKDAKKAASSEESQHAELVAAVEANSGDLCCFKLFVASDESEEVKALLTSLPRFSHRGAIERQEALGAERMVKSAS